MHYKMKNVLLIGFLLLSSSGFGQSLKKKQFGVYEGIIPAYVLDLGEGVINVKPETIRIEITAASITQTIGTAVQSGTWEVLDGDQDMTVLLFHPEDSLVTEHITVYKKGKKITRDGIYPQPQVELKKL